VYRPGLLLQPKFHDSVVHSSKHGVLRAANTCEPVTLNNASDYRHRRGNDFSVRGAKFGEKQSRQSNSKYNFMQNMFFFEKGTSIFMHCTMGSGTCSRSWGIFEHFCVKSNPTARKLLLTVSCRKKLGEQDVLVAPQKCCWGAIAPPASPVPALIRIFILIHHTVSIINCILHMRFYGYELRQYTFTQNSNCYD